MEQPREPSSGEILEDGSICQVGHLSHGMVETGRPLLICFHGSGTFFLPTWSKLLDLLGQQHNILLFDRGQQNPSPKEHVKVMSEYLTRHNLKGPYILIAHSYGGAFAKYFLHMHREAVVGMVLAEAGKGLVVDEVQKYLLKKKFLSPAPLSVIRGNSLLYHEQNQPKSNENSSPAERNRQLMARQEWLKAADEQDEKYEKEQLQLSDNNRYVHLPDCGHNVIADRPDVVVQEVEWVIENMRNRTSSKFWWQQLRALFQ